MSVGGSPGTKTTDQQKAFASVAAKWGDIEDQHLLPLRQKYVDKVTDTGADQARAAGRANLDTQKAFGDARTKVAEARAPGGATGLKASLLDVNRDAGVSGGSTEMDVNNAFEDQSVANRQAVIDTGTGRAGAANAQMGTTARISAAQARSDADASSAVRGNIASLAGTAGGIYAASAMTPAKVDVAAPVAPTPLTAAPAPLTLEQQAKMMER